jgi:omega-6 fatty acid desaturase (delta-12 desaturase)
MKSIPELQKVKTTSFKIKDIIGCLRLKFWDTKTRQMVGLNE